ncbi:MAG: glycosyl transferase family 1, partial [Massilia sp.]|nr:glycosyl transferase family 1 [Massilia sp.]
RMTVVPNAVNLRHFPRVPARDPALAQALGLGGGPVLGFIGRFHPYEGLDLLLAAMPAMLQMRPGLQLLLAGAGPREHWLKMRALQLGLGNSVVFACQPAPERSAAFHALADVLVFPRLPARQADLVPDARLLEAMARGCLVAASDVGAHRELVEHGRTGVLFEAGKPDALADALGVLLAAPDRWAPMRGAARWFVEYQRSWDVSVGRYAPVYQGLLERRRRH